MVGEVRDQRGGIAGLTQLVEGEHGEALAGDLAFYYRIDLRDLYEPDGGPSRLTWYWLKVLHGRLPPESATQTALRDAMGEQALADLPAPDGMGPWSRSDMLAAQIVDCLTALAWMYASAHSKQTPPKPEPLRRPGVITRKRRRLTDAQRARLESLRTRRR